MPPSYNTPPSYTIISGSALVAAACGVQQLQDKTTPREQTIYAFDVLQSDAAPGSAGSEDGGSSSSGGLPRLENTAGRTFAVTQSVKPDGIKVDSDGIGVCGLVFDSLVTSRTLGAVAGSHCLPIIMQDGLIASRILSPHTVSYSDPLLRDCWMQCTATHMKVWKA